MSEDKKKTENFSSFFKAFADADSALNFRMAKDEVSPVELITTGSLVLDDALCGGIAKGRITQFYGPPASGKTLLAMMAILERQKEDPDAKQMFIDAEGTFSADWAEILGIDTSRILIVEDDTAVNGRKCFEMLLGVPKEDAKHILKGKSKEGFLDKIIKKEFNVNLIVLDSLGSIIPPGEDTSAVGKMNMSLMARFLTTTFKKLSLEVKKANVPFIVINHKRDNMDPYGADHTFSGGNTYGHTLSANIYFEAVMRKDAQILDNKENKIGHLMRATVEKNKNGAHPRKCEFKVNFSEGIVDRQEEVAGLAIDYDIVNRPNNVMYEYNGQSWRGEAAFQDAIKNDLSLADELTAKITQARIDKKQKKPTSDVPTEQEVVEIEEPKAKKSKKVAE